MRPLAGVVCVAGVCDTCGVDSEGVAPCGVELSGIKDDGPVRSGVAPCGVEPPVWVRFELPARELFFVLLFRLLLSDVRFVLSPPLQCGEQVVPSAKVLVLSGELRSRVAVSGVVS